MAKVSTNISIDADTKKQAQKMLADMGLDLSTAVNIFLRQVIEERAIPFIIRKVQNNDTIAAIENVNNGVNLSREFHSVAELMENPNADD